MAASAPGARARAYLQAGFGAIFASIVSPDDWELTKAMKLRRFRTRLLCGKKPSPREMVCRAASSRNDGSSGEETNRHYDAYPENVFYHRAIESLVAEDLEDREGQMLMQV